MLCASLKVDINSTPTSSEDKPHTEQKKKKSQMNNLPKATSPLTDTHTHRQRHTQKDTFCCQFLNKFSFASHKQPQVVSAIVEAFKLWNYITHVYRDVFVRFPELSKHSRRKETGGIKKKKRKILEVFQHCSKRCN